MTTTVKCEGAGQPPSSISMEPMSIGGGGGAYINGTGVCSVCGRTVAVNRGYRTMSHKDTR